MDIVNVSLSLVDLDTTPGLSIGESFQIQIGLSDLRNPNQSQSIFSGGLDVLFDPKVIKVDSISYDTDFSIDRSGAIDQLTGIVNELGATLNGLSAINDPTIATLNVTAIGGGPTTLTTKAGDTAATQITVFGQDGDQRSNTSFGKLDLTIKDAAPDLVASVFDAKSDHVLKGETAVDFSLQNLTSGAAGAFTVNFVYSDDSIIGNSDDVIVATRTYNGLGGNATLNDSINLKLPVATLNSRAQTDDPTGKGAGYRSTSSDYLGMIIDPNNQVKETNETNNLNQGKGKDKDDITYFPWDVNGSGSVTATDAIFIINRLGKSLASDPTLDMRADVNGSGTVTATDAIALINRLGYLRNDAVIEGSTSVNLPTITVASTDANAGETLTGQTTNLGTFTLTRTGSTNAVLSVPYTVSGTATNGTDYSSLSGTANFAAGSTTTVVTVTPTDDTAFEGNETVILTLTAGSGYALGSTVNGTVTIADNDSPVLPTITVAVSDANAGETKSGETANPGTFRLTRTGSTNAALSVPYTVSGTATNGTDYSSLNGTATFAVGSATTVVTVTPTDDTAFEGNETVILTLTAGSGYYTVGSTVNGTVTIADNDLAPYITVTSPNGGESFQAGSSYNITWNGNILENVKVDLYKAGNLYSTLFSSTANDGSETWTVPSNLASGSDYQIKISGVNNSIIYDYGNTDFTINAVKPDLKKYWFYYNFNPADYLAADSYNGSVIAPVGTYTLGNYQPENDYDFQNVTTEVGYNGKYRIYQVDDYDDNLTNEAGRVFVHAYTDRDNGTVQNFTPYKYSQGQAAGTNYLGSELDYINSSQSASSKFGQEYYEADPDTISIPTNRWKAEYYNGTNPDSGTLIKVEDVGDGSQTLNLNWGSDSPSGIPADNFSAWFTTTRYLKEGLYKITTNSDDGIAVFVGATGKRVEQWIDKGFGDTYTGYFYVGNGEVPIKVKYYENGGGASVRVEINPVNPNSIQESVNAGTNWAASVFTLNGDTLPNTDFYLDGGRQIASIDLGSATRNDGLKGINFNYGTRAFDENSNLPHDNYAVRAYTQAYFDGGTYKFRVSGDDAFQVFARKWGGGDTYILSSSSSWQQGYQEGTVTLDAGSYDLHFHYVEQAGNAAFDLSWEKVAPLSNPDIEIYEDFSGVSNASSTFKNLLTKATDNWDTIITNHRYSNGNLTIKFEFDFDGPYNNGWGGSLGYWNTSDPIGDGFTTLYLNPSLTQMLSGTIVRLVMHEIGHSLGLGNALNPANPDDNKWHGDMDNNNYLKGLMSYYILDGSVSDNDQMYAELEYHGYKFSKYGINSNGDLY